MTLIADIRRIRHQVCLARVIGLLITTFVGLIRGTRVVLRGKRPNRLILGRSVQLKSLSKAEWGCFLRIDEYAVLDAMGKNGVKIGNHVKIGAHSRVVASGSLLNIGEGIEIGDRTSLGEYNRIGGSGGVYIGSDTIFGQFVTVHSENHIFRDPTVPIRLQGTRRNPVRIGSGCWIGAKATILAGVSIGDNAVVAAGSVVTEEVPPRTVVAGVPAKIVRVIE